MSMFESAKDAAKATGEKVGDWVEEQKDRLDDKADEIRADGEVARKEAEHVRAHRVSGVAHIIRPKLAQAVARVIAQPPAPWGASNGE